MENGEENEIAVKQANGKKQLLATDTMKMGENGFDRGWTAKEILAATVRDGRHEFLITWNNQNKVEAIPASIANEKCPQLVIAFYESRLTWKEPTHKKPK